jgi:predicted permease
MSLVLLIGAGLFARGLQQALSIDTGFSADGVGVATADVGLARFDTLRAAQYYSAVLDRLKREPGITHAVWAATLPLSGDVNSESFTVDGYVARQDEQLEAEIDAVTPGYFQAFRIPLVSGRDFAETDVAGAPLVAIVNETMAKRYWPNADPVGKRLGFARGRFATVIGVARDVAYHRLREEPRPFFYVPLTQRMQSSGLWSMVLLARHASDADAAAAAVHRVLRATSTEVPVFEIGAFSDRANAVVLPQRLGATLLGVFGLLALVIASVGVYGVIAFAVQQRSREIGIRMALGAKPAEVVGFMLRQSMTSVIAGLVVGLVLARAVTGVLSTFLYGVSQTDAATFGGTSLVLVVTALLASYLPARRATRIDPVRTLRSD